MEAQGSYCIFATCLVYYYLLLNYLFTICCLMAFDLYIVQGNCVKSCNEYLFFPPSWDISYPLFMSKNSFKASVMDSSEDLSENEWETGILDDIQMVRIQKPYVCMLSMKLCEWRYSGDFCIVFLTAFTISCL